MENVRKEVQKHYGKIARQISTGGQGVAVAPAVPAAAPSPA
jgi:hypothetical protein